MRWWGWGTCLVGLLIGGFAIWTLPAPPSGTRSIAAWDTTSVSNPLRITVFGTSLTARADWPTYLEQQIEDCLGRSIVVSRIAAPGQGSDWALGQIGTVAETKPDLILLEFAINDADLKDGVSLRQSMRQHHSILSDLRIALPETRLALMSMSPAHGVRGIMRPRLSHYYAALADVATTADVGFIDVYKAWLAAPKAMRRFPDGLHPRNEQVREILIPPVTEAIARAMGHDLAPCQIRPKYEQ